MQQSADTDILLGYNARKASKARKEAEQTQRIADALLSSLQLSSQPQLPNFDPKFDDVNSKISQLESELAIAKQKLALYEQEQPRYVNAVTHIETKFAHQLPIVKLFLETQVRRSPTGKILNHDLNNALIDFADEGGVHIETYEVAKLMRHFGFDYSESNGKMFYRGLELVS